jgi:pyruvate/2-oxoglutarate dehydrogenase complex dihydrolipoamide acyltransferase (E2) component
VRDTRSFTRALSTEFRILRMPQLSPTTTSAAIEEWYLTEGSIVSSYDLALRVKAEDLVSSENKLEDGYGVSVTQTSLDVEVIEDGVVAKILIKADKGTYLKVNTPLALISEEPLSERELGSLNADAIIASNASSALWQAYLVNEGDACGTCG